MKKFFKNPENTIILLAVLAFVCFIVAIAYTFYDMLIDHYCTYEISVTEAMNDPVCKPYLKYLIK